VPTQESWSRPKCRRRDLCRRLSWFVFATSPRNGI